MDCIVKAVYSEDGKVAVYLNNGDLIEGENTPELDIRGSRHVVGIIPCRGLVAIMGNDHQRYTVPIRNLVLTADGKYTPLEPMFAEDDALADSVYLGMMSRNFPKVDLDQ